ncbi:DUF6701 domain-containing protein [Vibrio neonatus]|uniref:DUF6701 domain-containing protein n=1 Tax=Vibrio neonatus TaxID=278860 RepID=UPI0021C26D10|nr:DUF6701 domain-containing protein [Vibrio neonatus]
MNRFSSYLIVFFVLIGFQVSAQTWENKPSDLCTVLPNSIQSWSSTSTLRIENGGVNIVGTENKSGRIGFGSISVGQWDYVCDGNPCIADHSLLIAEPTVQPFSSEPVLSFDKSIREIPAGKYDTIELSGGNDSYEFTGSYYEIKKLSVTSGAELIIKPNTFIKVNSAVLTSEKIATEMPDDDSENVIIWGEYESGVAPSITVKTSILYADIFSRASVTIDWGADLYGAVTAHDIIMRGDHLEGVTDHCATPQTPPISDMCTYFPAPTSSNSYSNSEIKIAGGTPQRINLFGPDGSTSTELGFKDYTCNGNSCSGTQSDHSGCTYTNLPNGVITKDCSLTGQDLFPSGAPVLEAFQASGASVSVGSNTVNLGSGGERNYTAIDFENNSSGEVVFSESGVYWIGSITIPQSASNIKIRAADGVIAEVHFNDLTINTNNHVTIGNVNSPSQLILLNHNSDDHSQFKINKNNVTIAANLYISTGPARGNGNSFHITANHFKFYGSLTVPEIQMNGSDNHFNLSESTCGTTPPPTTDYSLSLTPAQGIQLTCTAQQLDFQVKDSSGNNTGAYTGDIAVTATGGTNTSFNVLQGSPQGGNLYKANSNGLLSLSMDENTVSDVVVTGSLQDDPSATSVTGNYKFVAYKLGFSPNPTNVVAGKPSENVSVQPLECLNDAPVVSADYNGAKQVELSATNYIAPSSTVRPSEVIKVNGSTTPQGSMNLDFGSNSTANIQVEYAEAGSVSYTMTDEICIDDGQGSQECREYSGEHQIQSRPWTFALCEPSGANISGTSNSGSVFKRSGEIFALNATPIRWVSNESTAPNVAIDVSNYCNQLDTLATKNFYADSAPAVSVNLSAVLDSPSAGELGSGLEGIPPNGLAHNTNPIAFSSLFWKEAGSLKVTADLTNQADYLFEPINPGYRSVGRFSPSQLVMLDGASDPSNVWTQWQYASNHDGFAYMSQQFPHSFKVQAQANDGTPTLNYGLFGNDYISTLDYMANTTGLATDVSLLNRVANTQTWTGADWPKTLAEDPSILSVQMDDFAFMKKVDSTVGSFIATEPDGPFNSSNSIFGLEVTTIIDDVNFSVLDMPDVNTGTNVGSAFLEQPEFRYGRMHLEDVGGNTGQTVRVPLRVEYWDDGEFKTNDKDSGSEYDATNHYCVQTIWNNQSATTNAALVSGGNHSVAQGLSDELHAEHVPTSTANTERAQVRLWLRQADDSPQRHETDIDCSKATSFTNQPWLQYNWRDKGDEDPSAVVTFGVFRGNDRIIFKGERALIGNEN